MTKRSSWVLSVAAVAIPLIATTALAASLPTMPPDGYDKNKNNPTGKVEDVTYHSTATNGDRTMRVYTPPGYGTSQKYPVIYAVHGVNAWPDTIFADWCVGATWVSDNLLAEKKIQPVIIVAMDDNNVDSHKELIENIIPVVEKKYSVIADADHRGIYGYSLGGGVTFAEGIGNLDLFHHISPTSAAPFNHPSDADMFPNDGAAAKQKIKTLFISCGDADWDGFYPANLATHEYCDAHGIPNYWLSVAGGGHDGGVWRPAMWNFLQLAFPATTVGDGTGGSGGGGANAGGATGGSGNAGAAGAGAAGGTAGSGGQTGVGGSSGGGGSTGSGGSNSSGGTAGSSGGSAGTGGVGGNGGSSSSSADAPGDSGCGCVIGKAAHGARFGGLGLVLGALLWARRRERSVRR